MNENVIPMFKKSGEGVARDVLKLKKLEAISEGWYKGQLISLFEKVARKTVVDGVLCYNTNIVINGYTSLSNKSEYAKNVRKLLKLFGMTDKSLANIYNTWANNELTAILLNFDKTQEGMKTYVLSDFKKALKEVRANLLDVAKIEIIQNNKTYNGETTDRPAVAMSNIYSGDLWQIDDDYFGDLQKYSYTEDGPIAIPISRNFSISQSLHFVGIKLLNSLGEDITNKFHSMFIDCVKTLIAFSGDNLFERIELTKLSESFINGDEYQEGYYIIETKEVYNTTFNETLYDTQFERYRQKNSIPTRTYDGESYTTNGIIANNLWEYYALYEYYDNDKKNDLFYIRKSRRSIVSLEHSSRYITVEGLKHTKAESIARQIATYADFQYIRPRKKKKFLGVGGFIGAFLGGIFEGIVRILSKIAGLLYYIPVIRLQIQFIGWLFSGKWSNDRERFKMIAVRIFFAIVAVLITVFTGGGGFQIALSLLASAYGLYTGIQEYDETIEFMKKQAQNQTTEEANNKLNEKLIDLSTKGEIEEARRNAIYKPFDAINKNYDSPFDNSNIYSPRFGL